MQQNGQSITTVDKDLKALAHATLEGLRCRWRELFPTTPPKAFGFDLLRLSIAQRIQENAYGKLPNAAQRELNRFIALIEKAPTARLNIPRRIKSGSILIRDWKSRTHRVMVLDEGFAYEGHTYTSLTEIAHEITGTHWNGPRFFGLRPSSHRSIEAIGPRKRGRPPKPALSFKAPEARHGR